MLPPERIATAGPSPRDAAGEQRGHRRGPRALDDELRPLHQEDDRLADLLVGDRDDRLEQVASRRDVSSPGCLTAMPSAIV